MKIPLINLPDPHAPADSYERRLNIKLNEILSAMRQELNVGSPSNFGLEVAKGNVAGHYGVNKFGKNPDIDIGSEDIWSQGGDWVPPTTARVHNIKSSDANDDGSPAGTGARTVTVFGLDANYALAQETVTMNGVTDVPTAGSYVMVYRMLVATAGALGPNVGLITATAVADATVTCAIPIAKGQSQLCVYQIPAGYTAYLSDFSGSIDTTVTGSTDIELFIKPFGGAYNLKGTIQLIGAATSGRTMEFPVPLVVTEKSIVKLRGTSDTANVDTNGWFNLILVKN